MKYFFAVFAIILCNFLFLFSPFLNIDNFIYDILMILSFPYDSKYEIAVVEIDEESLKFLGRWPWKRELIAQLITNILKEEPKILCIDIGFFEKSENDKLLIDALKSEIPIVLPVFLAKEEPLTIKFPPEELLHPNVYLGHLHILIDSDGEVRKIPSRIKFKGIEYPSFSVQAARILNFNKKIPAEINIFYQTPEPFLFYSALKVLEGNNLNLKGKIVFLGGTSEGLWDSFLTPISSSSHLTPGVIIQAHAFRSIISNKTIKILNNFYKIILSFILIFILIILKRRFSILFIFIFFPAIILIFSYLFLNFNLWISPSLPIFSLFLYQSFEWIYLFGKSRKILKEERKKLIRIINSLPLQLKKEEKITRNLTEQIIEAKEIIENLKIAFDTILENLFIIFYFLNEKGEIVYLSKEEKKLPKVGPFYEQISAMTSLPLEDLKRESPLTFNISKNIYLYIQKKLQRGSIVVIIDITEKELKEKYFESIILTLMHDLKAPLNIIEGLFQEFSSDIKQKSPEKLKILENQIKRIKDLVFQYEIFMKLRKNRYSIQKEKINIKKFMEEIISEFKLKADQKKLSLKFFFEGENLYYETDRLIFYRIITNIIDNSLKFTPSEGNILIRANINSALKMTFEDSGPGIREEDYEYLCEPFFRKEEIKNIEGLGLGLSFVKEALKLLNGKISFSKSDLGGLKIEIHIK